jgi:hypothetical protein
MPSKLETGIKEEVKFYLNEIQERNLTKKQISDITDALMVNDWLWETVHRIIENTAEKILKTQ